TERKEAEAALNESEEKYRGIFENSGLGIYQSTLDGRFLNANLALATMLGLGSVEELLTRVNSRDLYELPADRESLVEQVTAAPGAVRREALFRRPDGKRLVAKLTARGVRDEAGELQYIEGFLEDVTERRRA
ncbi:MAG TPA: hypothetical protein DFS52_08895, partial [Myxococcales bacterium]|nr:hypothetical protein [Myxococcales bacterium]